MKVRPMVVEQHHYFDVSHFSYMDHPMRWLAFLWCCGVVFRPQYMSI